MRRLLLALLLVGGLAVPCHAQTRYGASIYVQSATPTTGTALGTLWWNTDTNTLSVYTAVGTWTTISTLAAGVPAGGIIFVATGTCPVTFSEVAGLNGRFVRGTVAANGNVGGTGGSDTYTPAGTNSIPTLSMNSYTPAGTISALTFTGAGWSAPAIAWPVGVPAFTGSSGTVPAETFTGSSGTVPAQTFTGSSATTSAVSGGTPAGTNGASATSGNCAATNVAIGTGATNACKATAPNLTVTAQTFTGSALGTHTHTLTATGTNGTAAFTPAGTNGTVSFTPAGTIAWPMGVPTIGAYTPTGTINTPTLSGTPATLTGSVTAPVFTGASATVIPAYLNLIACSKD